MAVSAIPARLPSPARQTSLNRTGAFLESAALKLPNMAGAYDRKRAGTLPKKSAGPPSFSAARDEASPFIDHCFVAFQALSTQAAQLRPAKAFSLRICP
jgi:hypothetical protein